MIRFLQTLAVLFTAFIILVIYSANTGTNEALLSLVKYLPFKDKMGHFILIGGLTFFINLGLKLREIKLFKWKILLGSLLVFIVITIEELSQYFLPNRNFELVDLLFNYLGILVFSVLSIWVFRRIINYDKVEQN